MSIVTITVADVDLSEGTYKVDFKVEDSRIDDGQMTAAAVTALYVQTIYKNEDIQSDIKRFGEDFTTACKNLGANGPTERLARAYIRIEDKDLQTGRIAMGLTFDGGAGEAGDKLPTPANIVGTYLYKMLHDMNFQMEVWQFAANLVKENADAGATISNPDESPITLSLNDDYEAARFAA